MSRHAGSLPASYFDTLYEGAPDPWDFAASTYEREKYAATLAALPRPRYGSVLEVGCSIGVLTRHLADRCDRLLALDVAEAALAQARARCGSLDHVGFERRRVPDEWPDGTFDLILLSEVVYYLDPADLRRLAERTVEALVPAGDVLLVHWLGETDYPLSGDEAAERFIAGTRRSLQATRQERTPQYRLDLLRARGDPSDTGPP